MKNKIILSIFVILGILSINSVSALEISIDNYYPTPVEAGDYFNIWLQVTNRGVKDIETAVVRFVPSYPFSLDPGEEEEKTISKLIKGGHDTTIIKFKVRVDAGAKEGENTIKFEYKDCPELNCGWVKEEMSVTVIESQTMFDVVLQEITSEGIFIAIANIGKNPANAVTVRIPEQEYFKTKLVSASIVGNLASGDYTIVGFQIVPKSEIQRPTLGEETQIKRTQNFEEKELLIQIDYTDPLGIRRTIVKTIMLNPVSLSNINSNDVMMRGTKQSSSFFSGFWFWIVVVIIVLFLGKKLYEKKKKRKRI